jgi:hypothetical protein
MAYVPGSPDDEEAKRRAAAGNPPGSFGDTTPTSTPTKTNFVNVSDYLDKNPEASAHIGDLASGKLASQRDEAQSALDAAKSGFGQQVESGSTKLDQGTLDSAFGSPETFVQNPDNMSKFFAMRDAAYKGPQSFETTDSFAPTQAKIGGLSQTAEGLGTEAGRNALVGGLSTRQTTGKTSLNQMLLQGNPGAAQKVQDTTNSFKGVEDQWQDFTKQAPGQVAQAQAVTAQAKGAAHQGLSAAQTALQDVISGKLNTAKGQFDKYNQTAGGLNTAATNVDSAFQAFLARNPQVKLEGSSNALAPWLNLQGSTNTPTASNVSSGQDFAREAALEQLSGNQLGILNNGESGQAGQFNVPGLPTGDVAGGVTANLQNLRDQIMSKYQPLQGALDKETTRAQFQSQRDALRKPALTDTPEERAAYQAQLQAIDAQAEAAGVSGSSYWPEIGGIAEGLQYLPGLGAQYNKLAGLVGTEFSNVPHMDVPNVPAGTGSGINAGDIAPLLNLQTLGIPKEYLDKIGDSISKGATDFWHGITDWI